MVYFRFPRKTSGEMQKVLLKNLVKDRIVIRAECTPKPLSSCTAPGLLTIRPLEEPQLQQLTSAPLQLLAVKPRQPHTAILFAL
jgi:hypothetical protein